MQLSSDDEEEKAKKRSERRILVAKERASKFRLPDLDDDDEADEAQLGDERLKK